MRLHELSRSETSRNVLNLARIVPQRVLSYCARADLQGVHTFGFLVETQVNNVTHCFCAVFVTIYKHLKKRALLNLLLVL